jgi:hypothetical protein
MPVVSVIPQSRPGGGGGLTALLLFLVMGAFGLMIMLFVATTTHAPVMVPATPVPAQPVPPQDGIVSEDDGQSVYGQRWDNNGHVRVPPPQAPPMYQVRPRVVYPAIPNPPRDRDHERDAESHQ